jgi:hypothetical protein
MESEWRYLKGEHNLLQYKIQILARLVGRPVGRGGDQTGNATI